MRALALVVALAACGATSAQPIVENSSPPSLQHLVRIVVRDFARRPVAGVRVHASSGTVEREGITDAAGTVTLDIADGANVSAAHGDMFGSATVHGSTIEIVMQEGPM